MDKRFLIILAVVVVGLGGLFFFSRDTSKQSVSSSTVSVSNNSTGANTKNVEVLVYGDFQCPACGQFYPIENQVVSSFKDEIKFTFRHFPLEQIHPNARAASRAAEAAGKQGKFFEMHNLLYESQSSWAQLSNPYDQFVANAKSLGLDVTKFESDYASELVNSTINADLKEGNGKGVSGTPTYYIDGKKMNNADIGSVEKFSAEIQKAIDAKN